MNQIPECRRCSECANSIHHWIDCCEETETAEGTVIFDRICKHCECLGTACEECDGTGFGDLIPGYVQAGEIVGPDCSPCEACKGEGVIASCMYGRDDD